MSRKVRTLRHSLGDVLGYPSLTEGVLWGVVTEYAELIGGSGYVITFPDGRYAFTSDEAQARMQQGG